MIRLLGKWLFRLALLCVFVWLVLVVGGGLQAVLRHPDLQPWHLFVPPSELRAADMGPSFTLKGYLEREQRTFEEVERAVQKASDSSRAPGVNRYVPGSIAHPSRAGRDWNRTFEAVPADIRGGALLIHGLTDSPYSLRSMADLLREAGYYVLVLRMPGHGTVPAGLTTATWEDWYAAVRVGARHVRERAGGGRPFVLVGYSNGGALSVKYALDAIADPSLPSPTGVVLISPMIGVAPFAWLSRTISRLAPVPGLEKAAWLDVMREYNPFKYNSFPANAALQTYRLTEQVQAELTASAKGGRLSRLPPMLTFQSAVDATVSTEAVVRRLYDQLEGSGHELVLFDVNRIAILDDIIRPSDTALVGQLYAGGPRKYRRTLVTNQSPETLDVVEQAIDAGQTSAASRPLGLAWPRHIYSLSHVALPFSPEDPLYGYLAPASPGGPIQLGRVSLQGERSVLLVTADTLMRIGANPFLPYMAGRIREFVRLDSQVR
jgi:alpha-beta hydrolase superfamily lysophospholipase